MELPAHDGGLETRAGARRGVTIVLKPAEQTPLSALRFGELFAEAGIPDGVVNMSRATAKRRARRWPIIPMSTRSPSPGPPKSASSSCKAATGNLKRASLELGGKSPVYRLPGRQSSITRRAVWADAIFYNQGQCCTAGPTPVRAQVRLRQGRRGHGQQGRQYQGRPRPRSVRPARAASLQGAAHESRKASSSLAARRA